MTSDADTWAKGNLLGTLLDAYYYQPLYALYRAIECRIISQVTMQEPILDLGCGDGEVAGVAIRNVQPIGVDIQKYQLLAAKRRGTYSGLVQADATVLPFGEETFSTVFSNSSIEHIPDIKSVLSQVARVLRPGGKFVFTVPSNEFASRLFFYHLCERLGWRRLAERYGTRVNRRLYHYHCLGINEWAALLSTVGLQIEDARFYLSKWTVWFWNIHDEIILLGTPKYCLYNFMRRLRALRIPMRVIFGYLLSGLYQSDTGNNVGGAALMVCAVKPV